MVFFPPNPFLSEVFELSLSFLLLFLFPECRFGDRRFELEETWNPDLGPPFGVMHCVHCECVPVSTVVLEWRGGEGES